MVNSIPAVSPRGRDLVLGHSGTEPILVLLRLRRWRSLVARILVGGLVFGLAGSAFGAPDRIGTRYTVPSRFHPVVLVGNALPTLVGTSTSRIAIYAFHDGELKPIPYQFDTRDADGNFQFTDETQDSAHEFGANDECVFMAADAGEKAVRLPGDIGASSVTEIEIVDTTAMSSRWLYAVVTPQPHSVPKTARYVYYDSVNDVVSSDVYRASFFKEQPFLISALSFKDPENGQWSVNLVDTMKVRHSGKLFGHFDFVRTQADYRSRLVAVKYGPVRVIRRTANRVRVLGFLRTPTIYIDYLCYRQGVTMELLIDVPFRIGWFFSEMATRMTMDWNDTPDFPDTKIFSRSAAGGLTIDGKMSDEKTRFNHSDDTNFLLANRYGKMLVRLDYGSDLPVDKKVYLLDDRLQADPPEVVPGQFGNVGFVTTGWERMDTATHRMALSVIMIPGVTVEEGLKIVTYALRQSTVVSAATPHTHY
jgi:hypothetical protein